MRMPMSIPTRINKIWLVSISDLKIKGSHMKRRSQKESVLSLSC